MRNYLGPVFFVLLIGGIAVQPATGADEPLNVLIIDGRNNHDWRATTPRLTKLLERTGRFSVDVLTVRGASDWEEWDGEFGEYDALLLNYYGKSWPKGRMASFVQYVKNGGGVAVYHAALAAFESNEPYNKMIGLGWRDAAFGARFRINEYGTIKRIPAGEGPGAGHTSLHRYPVTIRDRDHPITRNVPKTWMHAKDELYLGLRGPARNMRILATGYTGKTGAHEPLLWTVPYGDGRVFVTALGHDTTSIDGVEFKVTLARGLEWAATGEVTLSVPYNFPGPERVRAGTPAWKEQGGVALSTVKEHVDSSVDVRGPYSAVKLPVEKGVTFRNPTVVTPGPNGAVFGANYSGKVFRLDDTDGDGLEETASLFVDIRKYGTDRYPNKDAGEYDNVPQGPGLRYPTGMVFHDGWLYVATTQEIARFRDTTGDGRADRYESFASGWPYTMHYFDWTMGLRVGPDGWFYTNLSTDYLNGNRRPDPNNRRGSLIRVSPDGNTIENVSTGLRYAYDLAFNEKGDLFFTDNKGGGNPTEELNHAVEGGNYGHNPHGKPDGVTSRGPVHEIENGAGSTGIAFNPPDHDAFGPTAGDAFITMWGHDGQWDHGSVVRVELRKQGKRYDTEEHLLSDGPPKVTDLCFAPDGTLYVAQFGTEQSAHTPYRDGPMGAIYRYFYTPWKQDTSKESDRVTADNPLTSTPGSGDPDAGKDLFQKRRCTTCHTVDGEGTSFGPDLRGFANRLDRGAVLNEIRNPSRSVKSGYETYRVMKTDGSSRQGRMVRSDETSVTLVVPGNRTVTIPRDRIENVEMMDRSLMPPDLLKGLSKERIEDLLAYLASLKAPEESAESTGSEPVLRMNAGGPSIEGPDGQTYRASRTYTNGGYGVVGGNDYLKSSIENPFLRTCRFGSNMSFKADVDGGKYEVTLIFAEPYFNEEGKRSFGVTAEGKRVGDELDPYREAGFGKPIQRTFTVRVNDGTLNIGFVKKKNHPLFSAIEIRRMIEEKE